MDLKNIGASNKDDAFYRYKMPRMITKTEGCGNGTRTKIENMVGIAKALSRPASYVTKYFGYKLGAQCETEKMTGTFVNGAHDTRKLNGLLHNFITKYVLCYGCGNPETKIFISISRRTHDQMVSLKCTACGFVSDVDPNDKLTNFIIKNTKPHMRGKHNNAMERDKNKFQREGKAAGENEKKLNKEVKTKGVSSKESSLNGGAAKMAAVCGSDEDYSISPRLCRHGGSLDYADEDEDNVKWQTNTSLEAMKQRMHEQLNVATAEMVLLSTNEFEKKNQGTQEDVAVNGSAKPQNNSDGKQTIPNPNPYDDLVEEIKDQLSNAATAAQLGPAFHLTLRSQT